MVLIDQHAAHESVLYYRLLKQWADRQPESQPMLDPLPVELTPEEMDDVVGAKEILERYGLALEPFGDTAWVLRAVPAMARRVSGAAMLHEVLACQRNRGAQSDTHLAIAASIACHSAVRAGQVLDMQEMEALSQALVAETNPQHCPHGRPTTLSVSTGVLERQFGRA
jgi:DNA mismatch repair protein MutL